MRRLPRTVMLATTLLATATPASAGQLDPRNAPTVTGDVSDPARSCQKDVAKRGGHVAAVGRTCSHSYFLQAQSGTRTYLVVWQQTSVRAKKGWCAKRVTSNITTGPEGRIEQVAPTSTLKTQRARIRRLRYQTTAGDTMEEAATFEQTYTLRPRTISNSRKVIGGGKELARSEWRGSTRKAVAVVHAVEISWRSALGQPAVSPVVDYKIKGQTKC